MNDELQGVNLQDPLPEGSMTWRRWITIGVTLALLVGLWFSLMKLPPGDVLEFAKCLMLLLFILWCFYFGGASLEEITRLVQSSSILKKVLPITALKQPTPDPKVEDAGELPEHLRL